MIYEERTVLVSKGSEAEYTGYCNNEYWPSLAKHGAVPVALLGGMIGDPLNHFVQMTRFPDLAAWSLAQSEQPADNVSYIECEKTRLLRSISARPKDVIPIEDRRAVYGYRRFVIEPGNLDEFVHCSEAGIWPRIESQGACILGLWTTIAATNPLEILLMTGYHSPTNWQQTRYAGQRPDDVDQKLWDAERALRNRRMEISLKSWVCLMRAYDIPAM